MNNHVPKVNQLISQPQIANHEQEVHSRDYSRPGSPPPLLPCLSLLVEGERLGTRLALFLYSTVL